jgi:hypothetical protein
MSTMIDLTGEVFTRLTVIGRSHRKGRRIYWHCKCECGAEKHVEASELRGGGTKSCGCLRSEKASARGSARVDDLTGKRFGRLLVAERSSAGSNEAMWACECDCGGTKVVSGSSLRRGDTRSCGCLDSEVRASRVSDLSGVRFGKLTANSVVGSKNGAVWLCSCDCGKTVDVPGRQLVRGNVTSCGCLRARLYDLHGVTVDQKDLAEITNRSVSYICQKLKAGASPQDLLLKSQSGRPRRHRPRSQSRR